MGLSMLSWLSPSSVLQTMRSVPDGEPMETVEDLDRHLNQAGSKRIW